MMPKDDEDKKHILEIINKLLRIAHTVKSKRHLQELETIKKRLEKPGSIERFLKTFGKQDCERLHRIEQELWQTSVKRIKIFRVIADLSTLIVVFPIFLPYYWDVTNKEHLISSDPIIFTVWIIVTSILCSFLYISYVSYTYFVRQCTYRLADSFTSLKVKLILGGVLMAIALIFYFSLLNVFDFYIPIAIYPFFSSLITPVARWLSKLDIIGLLGNISLFLSVPGSIVALVLFFRKRAKKKWQKQHHEISSKIDDVFDLKKIRI